MFSLHVGCRPCDVGAASICASLVRRSVCFLRFAASQVSAKALAMSTDAPLRAAPEGWTLQNHLETFSGHSGPFYFRKAGPRPGVGFFSEPRHGNTGAMIHGGALLTLADMSLFDICFRAAGGSFRAVTISLHSEFLGAGPIGEFIEATGDMTRGGGRLYFARGLITAAGEPLMSFSGILKRLD